MKKLRTENGIVLSLEAKFSKQVVFYEMRSNTFLTLLNYQDGCANVIFANGENLEKVVDILLGFFSKYSNVNYMISECMCNSQKVNVNRVTFIFDKQVGEVTSESSREDIINQIYGTCGVKVS